jgi:hypothetical protein
MVEQQSNSSLGFYISAKSETGSCKDHHMIDKYQLLFLKRVNNYGKEKTFPFEDLLTV